MDNLFKNAIYSRYFIVRCPVIVFLLIFCCQSIAALSLPEIQKLYSAGKYAEVKTAVGTLVKNSPKNASYNQWYGVCLFETGEYDLSEKYFKYASTKQVQESFRYLGKLYYGQYRFNESADAYKQYIDILIKKNDAAGAKALKPVLEQSEKAARMLQYTEDIQVIDSVIVDKDKFLNHYMLNEESGNIVFRDGDKTSIYTNQLQNKRYYSKCPVDSTCKLYTQTKLMDVWTEETELPTEINSSDTNYPFVLTDGVTIYFASKGHGAIGGYDLFVSRYNTSKETFLEPEQLGMPFNSIYDDYMLAIDDISGIGFFATNRFQPEGKVIIYTYLPNQEKKSVKTGDLLDLKERAKLSSIQATWREGQDYRSIVENAHTGQHSRKSQPAKDFMLIIDDAIIYESLADFKSDAAKSLYMESQRLANELSKTQKQLDQYRVDYAQSSGDKRKALSTVILAAEKSVDDMNNKYDELIVSVRNTEIKFLKQQKRK
ncbi:MAG: tetratricopeptide repeat protein [Dysgonamonadaceae bacterium]|jgi:hypothetical protein|nr:tetratricopeptide repeat protein [Dysgonamonadaceae bacterium]